MRIKYLDILRIVATLAVLINHIPLAAVHLFDKTATDWDRFFINSTVYIVHFAVPIFVMITGALLLQPQREINYRKVLTKYVWRMVMILATVGMAYSWMEIFFAEKHFAWIQIPTAIFNVVEGQTWKHMWYLYMLIGLYLVLPILKATVKELKERQLDYLLIILFLFVCVLPTIQTYTGFKLGIRFPICSEYIFYLLIGYRFSKDPHVNIKLPIMSITGFVLLYICFGYIVYVKGYKEFIELSSSYKSPLLGFYSILIFILFKNIPYSNNDLSKYGKMLSRDSFGIYVFHMLWVNIIYKVLKVNPIDLGYWSFIPILITVIFLSWATTIIFRKIPYIGKYI